MTDIELLYFHLFNLGPTNTVLNHDDAYSSDFVRQNKEINIEQLSAKNLQEFVSYGKSPKKYQLVLTSIMLSPD